MSNSLCLRTKMTLWYTGFTFFVAAVFCASLYWIVSYELQQNLRNEATLAMNQVVSQIENENGMLTFENEVPVSSNIMFYVTEENGSEVASFGEDITVFDQAPVRENAFTDFQAKDGKWLLLDSAPVREDHFTLRVRVAASYAHNQQVLSILRLVFLIGVPAMALIALFGGFGIARRALLPIRRIIATAGVIAKGDMSERIPRTRANDELGELTDALNGMLASVEETFSREKQFSSDASHELRTPVAVIRAYAETMLKESGLTREQQDSLQTILAECGRMQKITEQLLTLMRAHEKRCPVCIETIRLYDVAESVAGAVEDQALAKNIRLTYEIPEGLELRANQSLITQMLLNLVENAVKYGKSGGTIVLAAGRDGRNTAISVWDNGIGIPAESLPRIFDRFYRADASRDRRGTGLGLSIVQWIVRAHRGDIHVKSEPGQGREFIVSILDLPETILLEE